ncbi:hypothetical protein EUX98_g2247 [Antrodiella citrinella]|uniref:BTB domain-containing protein n=1 Tax=Antrodiella citrinella TaxID=2447956 RepID=A0A4V3XJ76_9APHY|nr:hypothetical protein EUX98_g2247 [Antrodiella citrinella]
MATTTTTSTPASSIVRLMTAQEAKLPANFKDPSARQLKRGDPWLDDGSSVLQAQDTYFRVHRSMLVRNADIFADMYQLPQPAVPADDQVVVDGCLVLQLADDPAELSHFLRAMYDGHKYFSSDVILPFEAIIALVRLGTKYQALHLREEGMKRLTAVVDSLLLCDESSDSPRERYKRKCAVVLANLAETHELDVFLPPALYACCQIPDAEDHLLRSGPSTIHVYKVPSETLLPVNTQRVQLAKRRLATHTEQILTDMITTLGNAKVWFDDVEKAWLCSPICLMNAKAFKNKKLEEIRGRMSTYFGLSDPPAASATELLPSCSCASI